jgi:hypothetical protein
MIKDSVVILASRYDAGSYYTFLWAQALQEDLAKRDHTCLLLDTSDLCRAGSSLSDAIDAADVIVFYGHGQRDEWTALPGKPSGATVPLVDVASVAVLAGKRVYAGCCHSLAKLGAAYAAAFPQGAYIGYNDEFALETENHEAFRDVVNNSVIDFVKDTPHTTVVARLVKAWAGLRDSFAGGGILQNRPNAYAASQYAESNRQRAGSLP